MWTPVEVDGAWLQQWSVVPLTQQEIDDARRAAVPQSCTPAQGLVAFFSPEETPDAAGGPEELDDNF